jgi:hypothetical protein
VLLNKCRTHPKLLKINSEKLIEKLLNETSRRYHRKFRPKQITQGTKALQIWHNFDCWTRVTVYYVFQDHICSICGVFQYFFSETTNSLIFYYCLIKQEKKDLLCSEAYISQICPLVFVIPNYFWNFDAQTILQLKPQCMIKNSFFLILIFNIHHKMFLVAMFINPIFLYYGLVLED